MSPIRAPSRLRLRIRSAIQAASSRSSFAAKTWIFSPSPLCVHSCLSFRPTLFAITWFAASRIVLVDR